MSSPTGGHEHAPPGSTVPYIRFFERAEAPSPLEMLELIVVCMEKVKKISNFMKNVNRIIDLLDDIEPYIQALILLALFGPFEDWLLLLRDIANFINANVSTAPEPNCPFLGLQGLPFEQYPVEEGLIGILDMAASCGSLIAMTVGGIIISVCMDVCQPWIINDVAPVKPIDPAALATGMHFSAINKIRKMAFVVVAKSLSEEEVADLMNLLKMIDTDNSGSVTVEELIYGIKRVGSVLTSYEIFALLDAVELDRSAKIDYVDFIAARLHTNNFERQNLVSGFSFFDKASYIKGLLDLTCWTVADIRA